MSNARSAGGEIDETRTVGGRTGVCILRTLPSARRAGRANYPLASSAPLPLITTALPRYSFDGGPDASFARMRAAF